MFVVVRRVARNEVYAHAVLGRHPHMVRYYSAWAEEGHLYIQNEYCDGGSLADELTTHRARRTKFTERELKDLLRQVSHGLRYVHAQQLAHMDIKPGTYTLHAQQFAHMDIKPGTCTLHTQTLTHIDIKPGTYILHA